MEEERAMTQGKLWTGLIVLFLTGTLTGIAGTSLFYKYERQHRWEPGPAATQERIMKRLTRELSLPSGQQADIEPIVRRVHLEILKLRVQHQPEVERILTHGIADLKTKLSTDQQARLDGLYTQLERRWQVSRDYLQAAQQRR
jgi:hypothetical protein